MGHSHPSNPQGFFGQGIRLIIERMIRMALDLAKADLHRL